MVFNIINFSNTANIVDLSISLVIFAIVIFFIIKFKFSIPSIITVSIAMSSILLTWAFELKLMNMISIIGTSLLLFVYIIYYLQNIKTFFKSIKEKNYTVKKHDPSKIIDHQILYKEIYDTVSICSKNKIGALITFERNDDLNPLSKNGTRINAPVTHELLTTIFYPGTRLHDGAVIIKDGMIYAASVYYTPTTKALTGKYGSRHRAALGISEISDSLTIVVSEETGRISFAENGELEVVFLDNFIRELEDKLAENK